MNRRGFLRWLGLAPFGAPAAMQAAMQVPTKGLSGRLSRYDYLKMFRVKAGSLRLIAGWSIFDDNRYSRYAEQISGGFLNTDALFHSRCWSTAIMLPKGLPAACRLADWLVGDLLEAKRISLYTADGLRAGIWPADPKTGWPLFMLAEDLRFSPFLRPFLVPSPSLIALALIDELLIARIILRYEAEGLRAGIWPINPETGRPFFKLASEPMASSPPQER